MRSSVFIAIILSLLLADCSKPDTDNKNCTTIDLIPIFTTKCALSGCHSGINPQSNLNLDSTHAYHDLSTRGYFTAGNPTQSIVYDRMTSTSIPMPAAGVLPSTQTDRVYCWIKQGGTNN
jgi:hypothetical protein